MRNYLNAFISGDWKSGLSVFLVALPLCLGIALASGAPILSGLIAGIAGGIIVTLFSNSSLSVSGPAAGLTVIVYNAIQDLDNYNLFLASVIIAGLIQNLLYFLKLGIIGNFFPSTVIKGMLSAIGVVIILKQIPHALGDDFDFEGDYEFQQIADNKNTFDEIWYAINQIEMGALIISLVGLVIFFNWHRLEKFKLGKALPASLIVVLFGVFANIAFAQFIPNWYLGNSAQHMVQIPSFSNFGELSANFFHFDSAIFSNPLVITTGITIAIVASLETLLALEATDLLDPQKRISDPNKELLAQGLGNSFSGFFGGIPVTSVIIRSSTNVYAGAKTKASSFFHGILLLLALFFIGSYLNLIPLASLASILLYTGYKLASPTIFKTMFKKGWVQFTPFIATVLFVVFIDLLWGIFLGTIIGLLFVLYQDYHSLINYQQDGSIHLIKFKKDATFLHKNAVKSALMKIPENTKLVLDLRKSHRIDPDIMEMIETYQVLAEAKNITVEINQ